ncbi:MAG: transposase, partial [Blastocatellia bacterium]|nr:transposase [Blastocatellia bacterium]
HLSKSISDVSWAMLFGMLDYKAVEARKLVNWHWTLLHIIHHRTAANVVRKYHYLYDGINACELVLNRDHNAARTILARGIDLLQANSAPGGLALASIERRTFSTESSFFQNGEDVKEK